MNNPYAPPQSPQGQYPQPYGGGPAAPSKQGSGLLVLGVFQIIFGVLGLLGGPLSMLLGGIARDPVSRRIHEITWSGSFGTYMRISVLVSVLMSIALIAAGIGVIKTKPWARTLSMIQAAVAVVAVLVGQVVSFAVLYPELNRLADEYAGNMVAQAAVTGGRIGGIVGGLFGLVFPIVVLVVMTRPSVKEKFAASAT